MAKKMIGIDIGGTEIKFALIDVYGNISKKWKIKTETADNGNHIPNAIIRAINEEILNGTDGTKDIIGIGIGVPGPISQNGELVVKAVNLGWSDMPLKLVIEKELQLPVILLNDANAAALGEMWKGAARGKANLVFVTLGTGVGGGIILNGEVLNGTHSSGGEIGHIPVQSEEQRICGCGNINCLETYSSANGLLKTMSLLDEKKQLTKDGFTTIDVFDWLKEGNALAEQAVQKTVTHLGFALAGIMNTIDVEEIVVGGGLSEAGDLLLEPLKTVIDRHVFPEIRGNYGVKKAELGNDAGIYGAVYAYLTAQQHPNER
ncbi:ROK family protein [Trichococcus shcherbakoviae]|jgi:glucokinase|uniref:Glucokinase n=1 Tax=Trichococcus shcherbakoviae subsp. psychrophilus TaxID=2585775 RepID=A0A5C5E5A4_9LACT|nr:ROK family protein [Trichococcus shcherbakoviae]TNV67800.1 ROK family protein [Trichococcus shcherbakoviae subsp. psychrophilus]